MKNFIEIVCIIVPILLIIGIILGIRAIQTLNKVDRVVDDVKIKYLQETSKLYLFLNEFSRQATTIFIKLIKEVANEENYAKIIKNQLYAKRPNPLWVQPFFV